MRKILLRFTIAIFLLSGLSLIAFYLWLRGDGFRDWANVRIDRELVKYNICLKWENLRIDPFKLQAEYGNVEVAVCGKDEPIFKARRLFVQVRARDLMARKFELRELAVEEPQVYVKFDADGRSNLSDIKLPETGKEEDSKISSAVMLFENGQIHYGDKRINFSGRLNQFSVGARPGENGSTLIAVQAQKSDLKYRERPFQLEQFTVRAKLFKERAEIEALTFNTNFGSGTVSGELRDWRELTYDLNLYTKFDLNVATRIFLPDRVVAGTAAVRGQVSGRGEDYKFQGQIESADLNAFGFRASIQSGSERGGGVCS
jgi:hypothetical protein